MLQSVAASVASTTSSVASATLDFLSQYTGRQILFMAGAAATAVRMGPRQICEHTVLGPLGIAASGGITAGIVSWFVSDEEKCRLLGYMIMGSTAVCVAKFYVVDPTLRRLGVLGPIVEIPSTTPTAIDSVVSSLCNIVVKNVNKHSNVARIHVPVITREIITENLREIVSCEIQDIELKLRYDGNTVATVSTYDFSHCKKVSVVLRGEIVAIFTAWSLTEGEQAIISLPSAL